MPSTEHARRTVEVLRIPHTHHARHAVGVAAPRSQNITAKIGPVRIIPRTYGEIPGSGHSQFGKIQPVGILPVPFRLLG